MPATPTSVTTNDVTARTDQWYLSAAPMWRALLHLCLPMAAGLSVAAVYTIISAGSSAPCTTPPCWPRSPSGCR